MLAENPPPATNEILLQGFKTVNIGPGMDLSKNDPDTRRGLARAARDALPALCSQIERPWARAVNGWYYFPKEVGQARTTDYLMRSSWQSLSGIVAHPPFECTCLWAIRENMEGLKFDADGGLRIHIQAERPSDDKLSNWLPAPKAGNFKLTMRNSMTAPEIVEQRYDPPVLVRLS